MTFEVVDMDPADKVYYDTFDMCGCGEPHEVHKMLLACLAEFDWDSERGNHAEVGRVAGVERIVRERPEIVAEFIGHFLDSKGMIEHGGSVYGAWTTVEGKEALEIGPVSA